MYVVHAVGLLVLAAAMVVFSNLDDQVDADGRIIAYAMAAMCLTGALISGWRARQAPPGALAVLPEHAPPPQRLQYYRRMLWLSALAFPAATAVVAYELYHLESGTVASVTIWEPFATVYRHFGFWPAVLSVPLLGLLCAMVLLDRLRRLESSRAAD
jgi:hypothetical protein